MRVRDLRRGNAAFTALSLAVLLGFGALAVDVAWVRVANAQLQVAVEAGALGGAGYLDATPAGVEAAKAGAVTLANANAVVGDFDVGLEHVQVGRWTEDEGFVAWSGAVDEDTAKSINALRIEADHDELTAILAGAAFGRESLSTAASALAVRPVGGPASAVNCYLPIALPDCNFPVEPEVNPPPFHITFGTALTDNVAWAHPDNANGPNVKDQLNGICGRSIAVGDDINIKNGVASNIVDYIGGILNNNGHGMPQDWPWAQFPAGPPARVEPSAFTPGDSLVTTGNWGTVIAGPIALIGMGGEPGTCAGTPNFNQDREITGFTYGYIYDARQGSAGEKGFMLQLDFVNDYDFGTESDPDALGNVIAADDPPILVPI